MSVLLTLVHLICMLEHSIILVEHHPDVIKCADHVIDLGSEGGKNGGTIVFEDTPEDLAKCDQSYTGKSIAEKVLKTAKA
ncbi:MAG: hypothetical protein GC178_16125 [Flavobacteriales bacterium]|nr:hypothetical protein [Flavobacteriales bacterium]